MTSNTVKVGTCPPARVWGGRVSSLVFPSFNSGQGAMIPFRVQTFFRIIHPTSNCSHNLASGALKKHFHPNENLRSLVGGLDFTNGPFRTAHFRKKEGRGIPKLGLAPPQDQNQISNAKMMDASCVVSVWCLWSVCGGFGQCAVVFGQCPMDSGL